MLTVTLYFLAAFTVDVLSWALHWGPQSQILVLGLGLTVLALQKFVHKSPLRDLGFRACSMAQVVAGIILPVVLLSLVALTDVALGSAHPTPLAGIKNQFTGSPIDTLWDLTWFLGLSGVILFLVEFVTEELMFRGYLLGKLSSQRNVKGLVVASFLFGLWHLPIAIWGVGPDPIRTPLYVVNMALLGGILGVIFLHSRSLIPVAAFHAVWNSLEYNLFGFMNQRGLFTGESRVGFDPEEGWTGMVVLGLGLLAVLAARGRLIPRAFRSGTNGNAVPQT